jgi:hypothetical protein
MLQRLNSRRLSFGQKFSYRIGWLIAAILLASAGRVNAEEAVANRNRLLSAIYGTCRDNLLSEPPVVASLAMSGATMNEVCDCAAPLFVSGLSDAQVRELLSHGTDTPMTRYYIKTEELCVNRVILAHGAH